MKEEKGNSRFLLAIAAIITFYIGLSAAFYFDLISAYIVVGVLSLLLMILLISLFGYQRKKKKLRKISLVFVLIGLLFVYDSFLIQYESLTFTVLVHEEPVQAAENSGIYLMSVGTAYIRHIEDKEWLVENFKRGNQDLFRIDKMDNKDRHHSRNNSFLQLLGIQKDEFSVMAKNVKGYLGGETAGIEQFFKSEGNSGNSAGLALVLTGLIEQGKLRNGLELGVTGAIDQTGKVEGIGMIKEKVIIAEKKEYRFIIIPSENAEEAEEVKKEQNLNIQIFAVSHIDEAIVLIKRLNEEYAG